MKETLNGFQDELQSGRQIVTNLRYADDIILLATLEAELQELVDRLDRVSRKYSLLINVYKTKVIAIDGTACGRLIQNKQLEQMNMFPYLGSLIAEDGDQYSLFHLFAKGVAAMPPGLHARICHAFLVTL